MKIKLLSQKLNTTLSCISKSVRFTSNMISKKNTFFLILLCFLNACSSPTAMLGPAYTLSSTGNIVQASLNYGSNQMITMYTGKTPVENLKEISLKTEIKSKNVQKKTLESEDFYILVKNKIEKTSNILNLSN